MGKNGGLILTHWHFYDKNRYNHDNGVYGKIARGLIFMTRTVRTTSILLPVTTTTRLLMQDYWELWAMLIWHYYDYFHHHNHYFQYTVTVVIFTSVWISQRSLCHFGCWIAAWHLGTASGRSPFRPQPMQPPIHHLIYPKTERRMKESALGRSDQL